MFFGAPFSGCPFIAQGRAGLPSRSLCDTEALLQLPLGTTRAIQSAVQSRPSVRNIWTVPNKVRKDITVVNAQKSLKTEVIRIIAVVFMIIP